ncbi:hypothetical protein BDW69DRAFT_190252 [Aspergillus filifer]
MEPTIEESTTPPAANTSIAHTDTPKPGDLESTKQSPRNLWEEAVRQLTAEQKSILGLLDAPATPPLSAVNAIEVVVQQTEKNLVTYQSRGQIKHRDGTVAVDVRASVKKILREALCVKDIIDAGVKFDPSGYDAVFGASALLSDTLSRYANIEANYRDRTFSGTKDMEDKIVLVYKAVLDYSAEVRQQHTASVGSRILHTFYALDEQPLRELQESINSAESEMNDWRVLIEHQYRKEEAEQIDKTVNDLLGKLLGMSAGVSILRTAEEEKQFKDKINWLPTISTASKHHAMIKDRDPGTAEWIFADAKYHSWLIGADHGDSSRVLWLHGPYGCGKSVLFANVVNRLLNQEEHHLGRVCAYWYFDSGISVNTTNAALRSIIAQLAGALRTVPAALEELKKNYDIANRAPSTKDLEAVLLAVVQESRSANHQSQIVIAFDALDECPNRTDLLESLESLANAKCGARFLLTSRPEEDIQAKLGSIAQDVVSILDKGQDDVERFVTSQLKHADFAKYGQEIHGAIKAKLLYGDDRRFRLAALQLKLLKNCRRRSQIHEMLNDLPTTIYEA